jgi:hypothetical protein
VAFFLPADNPSMHRRQTRARVSLRTMSAAMILAAGRGQRMRPLTDVTPKPLLQVRGKALMQWPMEALARGGFHRLVVNTAWLGEQISDYFGHNPASNGHGSLSNLSDSGPALFERRARLRPRAGDGRRHRARAAAAGRGVLGARR